MPSPALPPRGSQAYTKTMTLAQTLAPLVDLVFPPRCPLCGEGLTAHAKSAEYRMKK